MTSIWRKDSGDKWTLMTSQQLPLEKTLHDMIESAPTMLPLSGSPRLVIVGREVYLDGNYADLIGIEPDGTIAVIEIKLAKNPEARRAVVAQILAYAASLARLDRRSLETHSELLGGYLQRHGVLSLADAVANDAQDASIDSVAFTAAVDDCLERGRFRLVLVLDEAPPELVRLVGYLESVTNGLIIDLVTVTAFEINGSQIVVPQRIDPSRHDFAAQGARKPASISESTAPIALPGIDPFENALATRSPEMRQRLEPIVAWARTLVADGLAEATTTVGSNRPILNLRVPGQGIGLVSVYAEADGYITLYRSVFQKLAPASIPRLEQALGDDKLGAGTTTKNNSPELLDAIRAAYIEAKSGQKLEAETPANLS